MPIIPVDDLGLLGVNTKLPPHKLPPNVLTFAMNCRATLGGLESINNYADDMVFVPASGAISLAQYTKRDGTRYWISATQTKIYAHNGSTNVAIRDTSITSVPVAQNWDLINFNGVFVANPSTGTPYYWTGNSHTTDAMAVVPGWTANMKVRTIRAFKNFIVYMNVLDNGSGIPYPTRLGWSHSADPGEIPSSWDSTDPTLDAGFVPIADTGGELLDGEIMGEDFIIYASDAVHRMQFTGNQNIFRFSPILKDFGALGRNCIATIPGGHLVLTNTSDVVLHDGTGRWKSILQDSNRPIVENRITPQNKDFAFVQRVPRFNEIWICLPREIAISGNYPCDLCLVYNYETGSMVFRELPNVYAGFLGPTNPLSGVTTGVWSADSNPWNTDETQWDENTLNSKDGPDLVMIGHGLTVFAKMDSYSPTIKQPDFYLERTALAIDGKKIDGAFRVDTSLRKIATGLWPSVEVVGNPTTVKLRLGGQEALKNPVVWEPEEVFENENYNNITSPTVDDSNNPPFADGLKLDVLVNTPLIAFAMRVTFALGTYGRVRVPSYDIDIRPAGRVTA